MPSYTYRNKDTDEEFTVSMSISEMEKYEAVNPQLERLYGAVGIVDPVGIGVTRPPEDFAKFVLGKVKAANPHTNIGKRRWDIPKEI
jgi:hypothetical protein